MTNVVRVVLPKPDPKQSTRVYCNEYLNRYGIRVGSIMYNGSLRDDRTKVFCTIVVDDETLTIMRLMGEKILPASDQI